jgi:hypothetical protein
MRFNQIQPYHLGIIAVCAIYLVVQLVCIPKVWLEVDELWYAHHIYQYTRHVPYLNFPPYKTVLGYYLLMLPLYVVHGVLTPIYFIKSEIALINTLAMVSVAWWAVRLFQPRAVFYTLVLIISNQLFLIYSTQVRVDMLASWLCLLSILLLINQRIAWAGVCIALAFLTSQKALWYIVGTNLALGAYWLYSKAAFKNFHAIVIFNVAMLGVIAGYIVFWASFSSYHAVLHSVFYEAYTQAKIAYYGGSSRLYWQAILRHGPLLIMLLPLTLLVLAARELSRQRFLVVAYGWLSLGIMLTYQQFFPYNTVLLLPVYFVLFGGLFSWWLAGEAQASTMSRRGVFWFFSVYLLGLVGFVVCWGLSVWYLVGLLFPVMVWRSLSIKIPLNPPFSKGERKFKGELGVFVLVVLVTGVFMPLANFGADMHVSEARYQRATIQLASELIEDDDYLAGTFIFHDKDQSIAGFENLIQPAEEYAKTGDVKLMPILIASLNITPKTASQMLEDLHSAPVKLLVNNVRIAGLPTAVLNYLRSEYEHYWGGIYFYAPTVSAGERPLLVKFSGYYVVEADEGLMFDQQKVMPKHIVQLTAGEHISNASKTYRLRLLPERTLPLLNLAFQHDCPYCFFREPLA